ncbi:hypothetical protein SAMN02927937_00928 [Paenimyroides aquimaris]|uniref:Uncharacterized protein n=1 Tax=Paenimyroides marinum TaxID=1159016 RepID=A0A1H6KEK7_9FLAO|nr:hypothetical protein SAMN02927937_00928 [Paenimyroides aquimaris]
MKSTLKILSICLFSLSGFAQGNNEKYENRIVEASDKYVIV